MYDEVGDLKLFVEILNAGSLSETARRSGTSVASVSRRLQALEDRLGVRLIDRGSRKFVITEEGRLLREKALAILDATEAALAEVRASHRAVQGKLRVSAPCQIGRHQIAALCRGFVNLHPDVVIELMLSDARPGISENDLDVAFQTKRPTDGQVVQRRLLSSRRVICAAPDYLERHGVPQTPDDLRVHNCIRLRRGSTVYDEWIVKSEDGRRKVTVSGSLVTDSTETIHNWALDGAGIAVKALYDIEEDLRERRLVELLRDFSCDEIHLYVTHFARRHLSLRTRLFIDHVAERLPRMMKASLEGTNRIERRIVSLGQDSPAAPRLRELQTIVKI